MNERELLALDWPAAADLWRARFKTAVQAGDEPAAREAVESALLCERLAERQNRAA